MDYFIYDGSFQGLLTAIYEAFYSKNQVRGILREDEYQPAFFANKIPVEADLQKSDQLYLAIKNKISPQSLRKSIMFSCRKKGDWSFDLSLFTAGF